jgi:hypothetical protein
MSATNDTLPECNLQITLFPTWFISDLAQYVLFTAVLIKVFVNWYDYVLPSINWKMYVYMFLMLCRPVFIYIGAFTKMNKNLLVSLVWFIDTGLYFLFYYLIFKMKVIQLVMQENLQLRKEFEGDGHQTKQTERDAD